MPLSTPDSQGPSSQPSSNPGQEGSDKSQGHPGAPAPGRGEEAQVRAAEPHWCLPTDCTRTSQNPPHCLLCPLHRWIHQGLQHEVPAPAGCGEAGLELGVGAELTRLTAGFSLPATVSRPAPGVTSLHARKSEVLQAGPAPLSSAQPRARPPGQLVLWKFLLANQGHGSWSSGTGLVPLGPSPTQDTQAEAEAAGGRSQTVDHASCSQPRLLCS